MPGDAGAAPGEGGAGLTQPPYGWVGIIGTGQSSRWVRPPSRLA